MKITDKTFFKSSFPFDLDYVNSVTKYPSIPTYHEMYGGRIQNRLSVSLPPGEEYLYPTEKIDGTNARIILFGDKLFIGSREELLFASGDCLYSNSLGIADTLGDFASRVFANSKMIFEYMNSIFDQELRCVVFYGEVYGGKIGKNAKQYSENGNDNPNTSFRLFDTYVLSVESSSNLYSKNMSDLSIWRENGGQTFVSKDKQENSKFQSIMHLAQFCRVPMLPSLKSSEMPATIEDTYSWLKENSTNTRASICKDFYGDAPSIGKSEGIVLRNADRSFIVKIRHEDYEKALNIRHKN